MFSEDIFCKLSLFGKAKNGARGLSRETILKPIILLDNIKPNWR